LRLGNDIVDRAATAEHNPRFIDRILNPEEKSRHAAWSLDEPLLWLYWACKEAAYKAMRQTHEIPFHHREFIVAPDLTSIRYHQTTLHLSTRHQGAAIFAMATDADIQTCHSQIFAFDLEPAPNIQSDKARAILLDLAAANLLLPRAELSIITENRIPKIVYQSRILNHPVSLTHHGRYVAASLLVS